MLILYVSPATVYRKQGQLCNRALNLIAKAITLFHCQAVTDVLVHQRKANSKWKEICSGFTTKREVKGSGSNRPVRHLMGLGPSLGKKNVCHPKNVENGSAKLFARLEMTNLPAICKGLAGCRGLRGSPAPNVARSTTSWSARQNRPSSLRANSSPGMSCRLQATHRKHSIWYTFERALMTKSFLLKPMLHFAHFIPYNL